MVRLSIKWIFTTLFGLLSWSASGQIFSDAVRNFIAFDSPTITIRNVDIIDGTGGPVLEEQDVLIQEGKIVDLGDHSTLSIPVDAVSIDGTGHTLIPGLIMLHEHLFYTMPFEGQFGVNQMAHTFPRLYLAGGVTAMRTAGSVQPGSDIRISDLIDKGQIAGPEIDVTGPFINREAGNFIFMGEIQGPVEASRLVDFWADQGATSFKVYQNIHKEDLKSVVQTAHSRGMKVTGHLCSITYQEAADIGIDGLEHGFFMASDFVEDKMENICEPFERSRILVNMEKDDPKMTELIEYLVEKNVSITSTLPVFEPYHQREVVPGGGLDALIPQARERLLKLYAERVKSPGNAEEYFHKQMAWEKQFYEAGGLLVTGTDPTGAGRVVAGYANQRTIELLIEAGYPITDAIKIATLNGAIYMEVADRTGSIEKGKNADLVLIRGKLANDVQAIRNMIYVFKGGVAFDSRKLFESVQGQVGLY